MLSLSRYIFIVSLFLIPSAAFASFSINLFGKSKPDITENLTQNSYEVNKAFHSYIDSLDGESEKERLTDLQIEWSRDRSRECEYIDEKRKREQCYEAQDTKRLQWIKKSRIQWLLKQPPLIANVSDIVGASTIITGNLNTYQGLTIAPESHVAATYAIGVHGDRGYMFIDLAKGVVIKSVPVEKSSRAYTPQLSKNGRVLFGTNLSIRGGGLSILDVATGEVLSYHKEINRKITLLSDNRHLLFNEGSRIIIYDYINDVGTDTGIKILPGIGSVIVDERAGKVAFMDKWGTMATASIDISKADVKIFDIHYTKYPKNSPEMPELITFTDDGKILAITDDCHLVLFDSDDTDNRQDMGFVGMKTVKGLHDLGNGRFVITGMIEGKRKYGVLIVDLNTKKTSVLLSHHSGEPYVAVDKNTDEVFILQDGVIKRYKSSTISGNELPEIGSEENIQVNTDPQSIAAERNTAQEIEKKQKTYTHKETLERMRKEMGSEHFAQYQKTLAMMRGDKNISPPTVEVGLISNTSVNNKEAKSVSPPAPSIKVSEVSVVETIGVYEGAYPPGITHGFQYHPTGTIDLEIGYLEKPHMLVLSSCEPVDWNIKGKDVSKISHIILSGPVNSDVVFSGQVTILRVPKTCAFRNGTQEFEKLSEHVYLHTGKRLKAMQGVYKGARFSLGRVSSSSKTAGKRWVDDNGVVNFGDAPK